MKINKKAASLILICMTIVSCNKLDELTEFDVTDSFETSINVNVTSENSEPQAIAETGTLNIGTNQDIRDNLDLIQNISIRSISYEIKNFTGVENTAISNANLNFGNVTLAIEDIKIEQADTANTTFTIDNNGQLNAIGELLKNASSITTSLTGTVSSTPITFEVFITVNLTATIDAL